MVTVLEPREVIPRESTPALEVVPPRPARTYELGYSVPCAGVRFYSLRPAEQPRPVPASLPVKLIDERVILI